MRLFERLRNTHVSLPGGHRVSYLVALMIAVPLCVLSYLAYETVRISLPSAEALPTPTLELTSWPASTVTSTPSSTPAPTTTPTVAAVEDSAVYHVVRRGDTLTSIAAQYGATVGQIVVLNGIANPHVIDVGQRLLIHAPAGWEGPEEESERRGIATTDVNLRYGPGTNYGKVGLLCTGERVEVLGCTEDREWYRAKTAAGKVVWVAAAYVAVDPDRQVPTVPRSEIPAP